MTHSPHIQQQPKIKKPDERILVVERNNLFAHESWQGLNQKSLESFLTIIQEKKEFKWRSQMENDPTYKQIIPYLIFQYHNTYFLMQRHAQASEKRLKNKYSLGIGGHIREEDLKGSTIFEWAQREFHEEVNYQGALTIKPLGILNDDSNTVGQVHVGLVLLLEGSSNNISIKSELQSGMLCSHETCKQYTSDMENWSQIIFPFLCEKYKKDYL